MKPKPKVGDRLLKVQHNRTSVPTLSYVIVQSVGRKYFTVKDEGHLRVYEQRYTLESWKEDWSHNPAMLYTDEAEYNAKVEQRKLRDEIQKWLRDNMYGSRFNDLPIETLKQIKKLIDWVPQ